MSTELLQRHGFEPKGMGGDPQGATPPSLEVRRLLDEQMAIPEATELGPVVTRTDIESSIGPFLRLPEYKTSYPSVVTQAIGDLFAEYNEAFGPLVSANQEWDTDYQYTRSGRNGAPVNRWVQIDMVGLPQEFLDRAASMSQTTLREALRGRIFEIENSLAMYQLLGRIHSRDGQPTRFDSQFRASLEDLRQRYGKPIALLAVTDQKYQAMKESEFGKALEEPLSDEEVRRLSGFDKFFGPNEFLEHVRQTNGDCEYLLYVRSSDPLAKLKKPDTVVVNPLLESDDIRRVIKAHAITFNIDNPQWSVGDPRRINDTKAYLLPMAMAYRVDSPEDAWTVTYENGNNKPPKVMLNPKLDEYLVSQGVDPFLINAGQVGLRAKPMQAAYGCYGHVVVRLNNGKDRQELRRGLEERGSYVIQPEMTTPVIINATEGQTYTYIDRNFFSTDGQNYRFMGGFRSLMPIESVEARQKRVHGNRSTVWAEVL